MDSGVYEMSDAAASLLFAFTWGGVVETKSGGCVRCFAGDVVWLKRIAVFQY